MVSKINMVLMAVCVLISVAALVIPYLQVRSRSTKLEAGLIGAVGYGLLGYVWQYVIYMFLGMAIMVLPVFKNMGNQTLAVALQSLLLTILSTGCTAASLYWGIYLTNQKQLSVYRSAAVGIGFSLGKIGIDLIYPYTYSFYQACRINAGTFGGESTLKDSICSTTSASLVTGMYKCLLMYAIIFAIALVMGNYYVAKNKKMAWIFVLVSYELVSLLNLVIKYAFGGAADVVMMIVFTFVAAVGVMIVSHWLRKGDVEINPLVLWQEVRPQGRGSSEK